MIGNFKNTERNDNVCALGDIIIIKEFKNEYGKRVSKHSFVVINDDNNYIEGFRYDFVANMLCSFHNQKHKAKKLKYQSNLPIQEQKIKGEKINNKQGYIKADQLYYFNKNNIDYKILGHIDEKLLDDLIKLILQLKKKNLIKAITTNIQEKIPN